MPRPGGPALGPLLARKTGPWPLEALGRTIRKVPSPYCGLFTRKRTDSARPGVFGVSPKGQSTSARGLAARSKRTEARPRQGFNATWPVKSV